MQALYITLSLVNINSLQQSIVGTGTINIDGSIGRIGGLEQKMITAEDAGIDVFFIPLSHQGEVDNLSRFSFDIFYVNSLTGIISVINEWGENDA
jgi:Lon-like protease